MANSTLVDRFMRVMEEIPKTEVPFFPDYINVRMRNYQNLREELKILEQTLREKRGNFLGFGQKMSTSQITAHETRIQEIKVQMRGLICVGLALKAGYEPYSPPENWYAGYAERPSDPWGINFVDTTFTRNGGSARQDGNRQISLGFSTPMPVTTIEKFEKAKKSGYFKAFIVAAPDLSLFQQGSLFCEPALIGYVQTETNIGFGQPWKINSGIQPGLIVNGAVGFKIDLWDLEKDREFSGIN